MFQRSDLIMHSNGPVQYREEHDVFSLGIVGHILFTTKHAFDQAGTGYDALAMCNSFTHLMFSSTALINHDLLDNKPYLERLNHLTTLKHLIKSMLSGDNQSRELNRKGSLTKSLLHHPAFWSVRQQVLHLTKSTLN